MVLPKIAALRKALPDTTLSFSERTATIGERLTDMTLDIGLIREGRAGSAAQGEAPV